MHSRNACKGVLFLKCDLTSTLLLLNIVHAYITLWFLLYTCLFSSGQCQSPMLSSTRSSAVACPDKDVLFICSVDETAVVWTALPVANSITVEINFNPVGTPLNLTDGVINVLSHDFFTTSLLIRSTVPRTEISVVCSAGGISTTLMYRRALGKL